MFTIISYVPTALCVDLITPLQFSSPKLRFHAGKIASGRPLVEPDLPPLPGSPSDWYVAQWQQTSYLHAHDATGSPKTGWKFSSPDTNTSLTIAPSPQGAGYIYSMFEKNGLLTEGGGSNIFLSTDANSQKNDFGSPIILSTKLRLTQASVKYTNIDAQSSGAVQAMAFIGLGLMFIKPDASQHHFVFMQIPISISRSTPSGPGVFCRIVNGQPNLIYAPENLKLPFAAESSFIPFRYNVSAFLLDMVSHPYPCGDQLEGWTPEERILKNWHFTGLYTGLEVQNRDFRKSSTTHVPQGEASLGLSFSELSVVQN